MEDLKDVLERVCEIAEWNPSAEDIKLIHAEIERRQDSGSEISLSDLRCLVSDLVPDVRYLGIGLEGLDTTDISVLLALATKATKERQ